MTVSRWLAIAGIGAACFAASGTGAFAQFNAPGPGNSGGSTQSGAASWPINTYMLPDEITGADSAIDAAGRGEIGATVPWSAPSGARGTITVADEIFRPGQPVCRQFAVVANLPARTQTSWVGQPTGGPFGGRAVEQPTRTQPAGRYNFTWTACRVGAGWTPR